MLNVELQNYGMSSESHTVTGVTGVGAAEPNSLGTEQQAVVVIVVIIIIIIASLAVLCLVTTDSQGQGLHQR